MPFEQQMEELKRRKEKALLMGGEKKIAKQHAEGKYTARERIDKLLDAGSFSEVGMLNHSDMPGMQDRSPADSKVSGYGMIDGRPVGLIAADFTVLGATSSRIAARKEGDVRTTATRHGFPIIYLGEAGGARMPDIMGSSGLASYGGGGRSTYLEHMSRVRKTPMVMAALGRCYGEPTWMACLADLVVMVKGAAIGVSGPRIVSLALGEQITDEELGGWELHARVTGMADRVAENEDECMEIIRTYLSYMPSHNGAPPPAGARAGRFRRRHAPHFRSAAGKTKPHLRHEPDPEMHCRQGQPLSHQTALRPNGHYIARPHRRQGGRYRGESAPL